MRLNNERDQAFVRAAMPEGARGFLDAIPALLLFKNGQEVSRSVGYRPAAELEAWLRENGAI